MKEELKFDIKTDSSEELDSLEENEIGLYKNDYVYKKEKGYLVFIGKLSIDKNLIKKRIQSYFKKIA